jgi:hypothetical protein
MYSAAEIKELLSRHRHFRQFEVSGQATVTASDFAARLPHVDGARAVRKYIETNQSLLQLVYGGSSGRVRISYNTGRYDHKAHRRIVPWVSIEKI